MIRKTTDPVSVGLRDISTKMLAAACNCILAHPKSAAVLATKEIAHHRIFTCLDSLRIAASPIQ